MTTFQVAVIFDGVGLGLKPQFLELALSDYITKHPSFGWKQTATTWGEVALTEYQTSQPLLPIDHEAIGQAEMLRAVTIIFPGLETRIITESKSKLFNQSTLNPTESVGLVDLCEVVDLKFHLTFYDRSQLPIYTKNAHLYHWILDLTPDRVGSMNRYDVTRRYSWIDINTIINLARAATIEGRELPTANELASFMKTLPQGANLTTLYNSLTKTPEVEIDYSLLNYEEEDPTFEKARSIPKIIHQMWLSKDGRPMPERYQLAMATWRDQNPSYEFRLWDNAKVAELMENHFPHLAESFYRLPRLISKCDVARMCVLAVYGGIYADLDFYCVRSFDSMLETRTIVLALEPGEHNCRGEPRLFNGLLGCSPDHPFIKGWVQQMINNLINAEVESPGDYVMDTTGPPAFQRYFDRLPIEHRPCILNCEYIVPYTNKHMLSKDALTWGTDDASPMYTYTLWDEGTNWGLANGLWIALIAVLVLAAVILLLWATHYLTF